MFGNGATFDATQKQAPYRWGQADVQSSALNAAEFAGKQLTGKKAQYAGDESMHSQDAQARPGVRRPLVDIDMFDKAMAKYGGKDRPGRGRLVPGEPLRPPAIRRVAQEQAPTIITKLKDAGVTTVILLADSAMVGAVDHAGDGAGLPPRVDHDVVQLPGPVLVRSRATTRTSGRTLSVSRTSPRHLRRSAPPRTPRCSTPCSGTGARGRERPARRSSPGSHG